MARKTFLYGFGAVMTMLLIASAASADVISEGGKTFIVDLRGERWDVTQALTVGFKAEVFRHGIGKNAFQTLDDTFLTKDHADVRADARIIGVAKGKEAKAYSVSKLARHEISNSLSGSENIAVAY